MRLQVALGLAAAALVAAISHSPGPPAGSQPRVPLVSFAPNGGTASLSPAGARRLASAHWWGGRYTTASGESVTVYVSDTYPSDPASGLRWAEFFAGLVHGPELGSLRAHVAPLAEVQRVCGARTLGCYGGSMLVTIGEPAGGESPEAVAAHEYGHHVASSRANPPWRAVEWGPKRWASQANVCARAGAGTAFPGDEGLNYELNPGEGFAEVYRVLNEVRDGAASFRWPVVDPSFSPDTAAIDAAEADVLQPWTAPSRWVVRGRFNRTGSRVWIFRVTTPLDGELEAVLEVRDGAGHELALLSGAGGKVLARGLWSGSGTRSLRRTVCGERAVVLRVTRSGPANGFVLRLSRP